jgi:hypothetical protein
MALFLSAVQAWQIARLGMLGDLLSTGSWTWSMGCEFCDVPESEDCGSHCSFLNDWSV